MIRNDSNVCARRWGTTLPAVLGAFFGVFATPALGTERCYEVTWSSDGPGTATATLQIDDSHLVNPSAVSSDNAYLFNPNLWTSLVVTIEGSASGNGTFTLGSELTNATLMVVTDPLDLDTDWATQGALSDFNIFGAGSPAPQALVGNTFGADGGTGEIFEVSSITPAACFDFPIDTDERKCQEAIGKAGLKYFAKRHKTLTKCRSALMKGSAIFEDEAETIPVVSQVRCANEFKDAAKIAKARQKLRDAVEKKCSDALLAGLSACDATVDGLVGATGESGCLVNAVERRVESLLEKQYGF